MIPTQLNEIAEFLKTNPYNFCLNPYRMDA